MQSAEGLEEEEERVSAGQQAGPSGDPSQAQQAAAPEKKKAGKAKVGLGIDHVANAR